MAKREAKMTKETSDLIELRTQAGQRVADANSKIAQTENKINELVKKDNAVSKKLNKWAVIVETVEGLK